MKGNTKLINNAHAIPSTSFNKGIINLWPVHWRRSILITKRKEKKKVRTHQEAV
jgi:hypothetical protein